MVAEETLAGCARHHVVVRLVLGALMRLGLIVVVVNIAEPNDAEVRISEVCKLAVCKVCVCKGQACASCVRARRVQVVDGESCKRGRRRAREWLPVLMCAVRAPLCVCKVRARVRACARRVRVYERVQGACAAGDVIDVNCLQSMTCALQVGRVRRKWDTEVCAGTHVNTCIDVH